LTDIITFDKSKKASLKNTIFKNALNEAYGLC